jgi:hypothetical protein
LKYTPEQHLQAARQREQEAKKATNPHAKAVAKMSAYKHRMAARAGRAMQAKRQTEEALDRAQQAAHATRSTPPKR